MRLIFLIVALAATSFLPSWAQVSKIPQVQLCEQDDCPTVSRVGLGTLHIGDILGISNVPAINQWLLNAQALGITLLDTADVYPVKGGTSGDSAILIGKALAMTPGLREKFTIVCKMGIIFPDQVNTEVSYLQQQVNWFLSSLQTNYLDVVLLHYSNSYLDADAVAQLFSNYKAAGTVRHFGVSNHYPSKFDLLQSRMEAYGNSLVTNEIEISVWNPSYLSYNSGLVDHSNQHGYRILAWSSLGGDPTGGRNRLYDQTGRRQDQLLESLGSVAASLGESETSVIALAWLLSHPSGIIPLIGTTQNQRVNNTLKAFNYVPLSTADWWTIASTGVGVATNDGGLCPYGDSQCDYSNYKSGPGT